MDNLLLKIKNNNDVRRIRIIISENDYHKIFTTISSLFKNDKIILLEYETKSLNFPIRSQNDWESAVNYASKHNNSLTILAVSESNLLEDSLLKEQNEFVLLGDSLCEDVEINVEKEECKFDSVDDNKKKVEKNNNFSPESVNNFFNLIFKQVVETVEETIENVSPVVEKIIDNNQSQFEQIMCTVKDTVDDVISNTSKNVNDIMGSLDPKYPEADKEEKVYDAAVFDVEFVEDCSIKDKTKCTPGQVFTKSWKIKNSGNMAWPEETTLQYVGGERMPIQNSVLIGSKQPNENTIVSVEMKAPKTPGIYRSYFRLCCPFNGNIPFGSRLWCEIVVTEPIEEFQYEEQLNQLIEMGLDKDIAKVVLIEQKGDLDATLGELFGQ